VRTARVEGWHLLRGQDRFADDIESPGLLHAGFLRSAYARARIKRAELQERALRQGSGRC
jgi:CO/xanthine dehydrogenase Mo-binding subunit